MSLLIYSEITVYTLMDALRAHFKAHGLDISEDELQDYPSIRYHHKVYEKTKSGKFRRDEKGYLIVDLKKSEWRTVELNDSCDFQLTLALEKKDA